MKSDAREVFASRDGVRRKTREEEEDGTTRGRRDERRRATTTTTKTNGNGANVFNMEHLRAAVDRHHRHISNEVERAWKERSKTLGGGFSFAGGAGAARTPGARWRETRTTPRVRERRRVIARGDGKR